MFYTFFPSPMFMHCIVFCRTFLWSPNPFIFNLARSQQILSGEHTRHSHFLRDQLLLIVHQSEWSCSAFGQSGRSFAVSEMWSSRHFVVFSKPIDLLGFSFLFNSRLNGNLIRLAAKLTCNLHYQAFLVAWFKKISKLDVLNWLCVF